MDPLLNPLAVRERMVLGSKPQLDPLIFSAIEAAQLHISGLLQTALQKKTGMVDVFYLDPQAHSGIQRNGMYRCRLTSGFVLGTPTVEIMTSWNNADASAEPADPTKVWWGEEGLTKGVLSVEAATHHKKWVRVTYDAGFENPMLPATPATISVTITNPGSGYASVPPVITPTGGGGTGFAATAVLDVTGDFVESITITSQGTGYTSAPTLALDGTATATATFAPATVAHRDYDAVGAPDWLLEGILAYVPVVFNFGPNTKRNPEAESQYKVSGDHAVSVVAPYIRGKVLMLNPL